MFTLDQAVLVIIDVQGKLAQLMHRREDLFLNLRRLIKGAQALQLPLLWTEQNPSKMGPTISELGLLLQGVAPISKMAFGCGGEPAFMRALEATNRRQVLLAGIECHVCVLQTALQLVERKYAVQVLADAVSSRSEVNYNLGLERIRRSGADVTCVESALFELMQTAEHPAFREVLQAVK